MTASVRRRSLLRGASMLTVGSTALMRTGSLRAAVDEATQSVAGWPAMTYRKLGNTGFEGSRLVFGCGAALSRGRANDLLEPALEAGINVFDVGYRPYYKDAEKNLAPFLAKHRDDVFLISKAMVGDIAASDSLSPGDARDAASRWSKALDKSLAEMQVDKVDAYYIMAANNTDLVASEEMHRAFARARDAGKSDYFGISTHENAEQVLLTAAKTGEYSLAQIAVTPAGWYDWNAKDILAGSRSMADMQDVLATAREAGIGLIGMKAGRHLAGRSWFGWGDPDAYDKFYTPEQMKAPLSAFQRSYAYVLANGLDAVNADMQVWQHFRENVIAATSAQAHFVA